MYDFFTKKFFKDHLKMSNVDLNKIKLVKKLVGPKLLLSNQAIKLCRVRSCTHVMR